MISMMSILSVISRWMAEVSKTVIAEGWQSTASGSVMENVG
jgi:hypothetical protein